MEKQKPLLEIKNVKKGFFVGKEKVEVLKGVNLEVKQGEFVVLIGPSGCGKSTLLNVILGLERPDEGEVRAFGKNVYAIEEEKRPSFRLKNFGVIYQQPNWIKALNVIENVAFPLSLIGTTHKKAMQKAKSILYLFKADKFEKYNPMELSGGEQQKLCVCRALITNPPMILADEPTGNLDSVSAEDLMYDLKLLNGDSKKTMVMVTHNPDYERYATKFVYMEDGVIKNVKIKEKVSEEITDIQGDNGLISRGSFWAKQWFFVKLSLKSFRRYKMRALLTSGGVALSIGFITFLISLSYGFQKLTTEGIKNMEAFQMLDVETGKSKVVSIDQGNIDKISNTFGVEEVYPMLSLAGFFGTEGDGFDGVVYGRSMESFRIQLPRIVAGQSFSSENAEEVI
ncbi:MAG: ATP-binding cassette domain-containing protein, partial [Patescibacteria group bacterium]